VDTLSDSGATRGNLEGEIGVDGLVPEVAGPGQGKFLREKRVPSAQRPAKRAATSGRL